MTRETLDSSLQVTELVEDESQSGQHEIVSSDFDLQTFLAQLRDETDELMGNPYDIAELVAQLKKENIRAEQIVAIVVFVLLLMSIFLQVNNMINSEVLFGRFIFFLSSAAQVFWTIHFAEISEELNNFLFQYEKQAQNTLSNTRLALYFGLAQGIDDRSLQEIITVWRNSHSPACDYVVTGETIAIARILAANNSRLENLVSAEELVGIDSWSTKQLAE